MWNCDSFDLQYNRIIRKKTSAETSLLYWGVAKQVRKKGQGCMSVNDLPKLIKEYGKDITFMGGIDNGKVDRFDWNQEMIEESTDQLCRDCGKLYFIPCTTHGLNFSCIPGVYEAVDKEIDKMTKEMF